MKILSCYNSYVDKKLRGLMFVFYPIITLIFSAAIIFLTRDAGILQGQLIILSIFTMLIYFVMDRSTIGPVYANWGKEDELLKSSPMGRNLFENVMQGEWLLRLFLSVIIYAGMIPMILLSGAFSKYYSKLFPTLLLCIIAFHAISTVMVNVLRSIEGLTAAWLVMVGITYALAPAFFAILIGNAASIWILCVIYLVTDIIATILGRRAVDSLVNDKWYLDSLEMLNWYKTKKNSVN